MVLWNMYLRRIRTKVILMTWIIKRLLTLLGYIVRKECLENIILTGQVEGKKDKGKS